MNATDGLAGAIERLRRGDLAGARAAAEGALRDQPDSAPLLAFAGLAAAQAGDPEAAAGHFRRALALEPADLASRINLATALIAVGKLDEVGAVCAAGPRDPKLLRLAAYVDQQQGRPAEAARAYEAVVVAFPTDFESWNNLGNALAAAGDRDGAIAAFERSIALRPDMIRIHLNLSEVLVDAERHEARQRLMREAARIAPDDAVVQAELGLAEATMQDLGAAEAAFRAAIRLSPGFTPAYLDLGLLLETLNRADALADLIAEAEARGVGAAELDFLRAWSLRRQGRFEEAMPLALAIPASINPIRRAQLVAEIADRLGDADAAFAAFDEMNAASASARPVRGGPAYREEVEAGTAWLAADPPGGWTKVQLDEAPASPVFILGFPRSGTTLLDTLLMNMDQLHVLEEPPIMRRIEAALGEVSRIASLDSAEANRFRALYFEHLAALSPPVPGRTIVDKHPFHTARLPLIHRLFPDARIVFVERHPCDAVLSCFMSNFELNRATRSFTTLEETARTYDAVLANWAQAEALLPVSVHRVRYERMIEDLAAEMRPLLDFIGLPWDDKVLDNRGSAARRDQIRTASYAQVTEPIYRRSSGRWRRYQQQMEPVLPILAPWAERMGYEI